MKKYLLLVVCSILLLFSCNDNDEQEQMKNPVNVQLIGKGNLSGDYVAQQSTVITNTTQWNNFLADLDSVNNVSGSFTETNIDFNQYMVIVVFDEVYNNGGAFD